MRDPRVAEPGEDPRRLLDRGQGGRDLPDRGPVGRRAADRRRLRGGPRGRRPPGRRACRSRASRRPTSSDASDAQLEWISPLSRVGRRARPTAGSRSAPTRTRASSPASPPERQTQRQAATRELMETTMRARGRGRAPLGLHALPDQRLRLRRRDEPARVRGLLLPRLPRRRRRSARRLEARLGGVRAAGRVDRGPRGGPRSTRAGHRHHGSASRGARSSPATASTTCPTASSSPARSRTRSRARSRFHLPAMIGGREVAGVRLRFEAGKVVDATRRARRGVPDRAARHRRGRPAPRRARDRHQLRDRPRHPRRPARREDRRHRPPGGRRQLPGDRRRQRERRPHRHGLRPAPGRQDRGRRRAAPGGRQFVV